MRIAIDGTTLPKEGTGAGIEHYTRAMVDALPQTGSGHRFFVVRPFGTIPFVSRHVLVPAQAYARGANVLFAPAGHMPLGWRGKTVLTVHDAAIYEHPEWFDGLGAQEFSVKVMVPKSIERADRIIVPSRATQEQVERVFASAKGKTVVITEGVRVPSYGESRPIDDRAETVAFIGTIEPRKNLMSAIRAFNQFLEMHPDHAGKAVFIIAGRVGWQAEDVLKAVAAVNDRWSATGREVIRQVGPVTEQEKWALLQQASVLLFPSLWEGFGLPVLEAMAVGTPVITSTCGALPEVGGDAALYVEPDDVEQMSLAIAQCLLLPDAMRELVDAGKKRAAQFTWEQAARETVKVFESL